MYTSFLWPLVALVVESEFQSVKKRAKTLLEKAKLSPLDDALKDQFADLPNTLQELEDMISSERIKAELKFDVSPKVIEEYDQRAQEVTLMGSYKIGYISVCTWQLSDTLSLLTF